MNRGERASATATGECPDRGTEAVAPPQGVWKGPLQGARQHGPRVRLWRPTPTRSPEAIEEDGVALRGPPLLRPGPL